MEATELEEKTIRAHWESLTIDMSLEMRETWWDVIKNAYDEDHRQYHTLDHVADMFNCYEQHKDKLTNSQAVAYAILFHNIVYQSKATDNDEKSSEMFTKYSTEAGISTESDLYKSANELILLIKAPLTEAHLSPNAFGSQDKHYFLDFDLAVFGTTPEEYKNYTKSIRKEYEHLDDNDYRVLRLKVIQSFQHIPNIFATEFFRTRFESQARENINKEIESLKKQ